MDEQDQPPATPAPATPHRRGITAGFGRGLREILETVALALIIFLGVRMVVLPYEVEGASMRPNLENRERVLVNRLAYSHVDLNEWLNLIPFVDRGGQDNVYPFNPPHRGDIIVFHPPVASTKPYVKRVIGLPGDSVTFKDGYVYINGQLLDESYIDGPITRCQGPNCHIGPIPAGYVFVLGDNRTNSSDSRVFGLVPMDAIVGKAVFANWPLDMIGPVSAPDYPS